jgi:hypothetical protein
MYYQLQYYYDNKAKIRAKDNTPEAKAKRKAYFAQWYAANKERVLAKNKKVKMPQPPKVVEPELEVKEKLEIFNSGPKVIEWN